MTNYTLSIPESARFLGIGVTKLYQLLKGGTIPAKKIGRRTFILREELENFIKSSDNYLQNGGSDV